MFAILVPIIPPYKFIRVLLLGGIILCSVINQSNGASLNDTIYIGKYLKIHPLNKHVYRYIFSNYYSFTSNGVIYINNNNGVKEALLVDVPSGDGITDSLLDWITIKQGAVLKAVVVTHWHIEDRMGGIVVVNSRHIPSYCLDRTMAIVKEQKRPYPAYSFKDTLTMHIGAENILLCFPGAGHTLDNMVVWFPTEKILFGGCLVKAMSAQDMGYTADADLKAWPASIKYLLKNFRDANIVIPGHNEYGGKDLLFHTLDLLKKQDH